MNTGLIIVILALAVIVAAFAMRRRVAAEGGAVTISRPIRNALIVALLILGGVLAYILLAGR